MSFNYGSLSYIPSSFSSSSSSDNNYYDDIEKQVVSQITTNNNFLCSQHLYNSEGSHGGSIHGHVVINRDRENVARNLFIDYFAEKPVFPETMFRRRFRMSRSLFLRIYDAIKRHDNYFVQRRDGVGKLGLSGLQKMTAAFRMLAYGVPADSTDEYIKIGESTALESLKRFCRAIVEVFACCYLRSPDANDVARLLHIGESRGFPAEGTAPPASYVINGKPYNMGYYLADGIYPKWSTLVQTIHDPRGPKKKLFAMKQEACRKDVERAFGVLQLRFAIVAGPSRLWNKTVLHDIMTSCIIMHNMIIEDERDIDAPIEERVEVPIEEVEMTGDDDTRFQEFLARH
ncbi:nuclease [Arabidopsis thaliana]|uniref:Nuclease n=2 Tax=Arabidopsis thaliana TaxID=3702 RepID=Q1PF74_ARATH|nr:nuclease [Arabidopsis thaliana]ABE65808.1 hypothetical protein At2g13770 [Arabidopsis thaliana]AEC06258.1 nuclease [Arabidopsis thaliana]|eukprot:NP_178997.2 nuclease [Arabidopsis thaliana]